MFQSSKLKFHDDLKRFLDIYRVDNTPTHRDDKTAVNNITCSCADSKISNATNF